MGRDRGGRDSRRRLRRRVAFLALLPGRIATDSSIAFTLTQARWGSCTMTGGGQYTGIVTLGSLVANGRAMVQCDDGQTMTIEEQLTGSLPVPPSLAPPASAV